MVFSAFVVDLLAIIVLAAVSVAAACTHGGRYLVGVAVGVTLACALLGVWLTADNVDGYPLWFPMIVGAGIPLLMFLAARWASNRELGLARTGLLTLVSGLVGSYVVPLLAFVLLFIHSLVMELIHVKLAVAVELVILSAG